MITIHDVAKRAGVSVTTVSNVINSKGKFSKDTKDKVEKTVKELNYIPNQVARGLKTSNTHNISIICEDINSLFSDSMIDGICSLTDSINYSINLSNLSMTRKMVVSPHFEYKAGEESPAFKTSLNYALENALTIRSSGIIYIGIHPRDVTNLLPDADIPVVYLYSYTHNQSDTCINYDDFQGAKVAVNHLVELGHKKIATICGSVDSIPSHKRLLGYQTALMESNIAFYPEYVVTADWHYEDGYNACQTLMNLPEPPTAIFVMSDLMSYGAVNYAHDHNIRIPEDLSIIGFDNLPYSSHSYPSLSSVEVPLFEMGQYAAESLVKLVKHDTSDNYTKLFSCNLVTRKSTNTCK